MMGHREAIDEAAKAWEQTATHRHGVEAAIRAYLDARDMVMVPRLFVDGSDIERVLDGYTFFPRTLYSDIIAAAQNPFTDSEQTP